MAEAVVQPGPGAPAALPALTGARFVAAAVVVLHHYAYFLPYPAWLARLAAQGQAGVSFFFLLSGFILAYNYHGWFAAGVRAAAYRAFLRARFARVYPLHLLTLLLATPLVLGQWWGAGAPAGPSAKLLVTSWLAHLALLQAWVPVPLLQNLWNAPSWSISAELLFYLLFPPAMAWLAGRGWGPGRLLAFAGVVLAAEAGATLLAARAYVGAFALPAAPGGLHWVVSAWAPLRVGEFLIGCALGAAFLADRAAPHPAFAPFRARGGRDAILALALLAAYALCWLPAGDGALGFATWVLGHNVAFVAPFALVILCLAAGPTWLSGVLGRPLAVLLGEASYALYLLHALPIMALAAYVRPAGPALPLLAMALTVPLAVLCFRAFETPARRWLRGPRPADA